MNRPRLILNRLPLILLALIAFTARAQENESYYDADWKPIKRKKATYLTHMHRMGKKNGEFYKVGGDSLHPPIKYIYRDDALVDVIDRGRQKKDSVKKYDDEIDSEYPGGASGWLRYLNKHMRYPDRAIDATIQGEVRISFIVDKNGSILDLFVAKSVEYSIDDAALQVVHDSGKWSPAFQNGKYVKSYKTQPIVFKLQRR